MNSKKTRNIRYSSEWLNLVGIALSLVIAVFSVIQPLVAMGLALVAALCFSSAWYLSRKERKHDAMAAEQRLQQVRQEGRTLAQQVQDDAELRFQDLEERSQEFDDGTFLMDERYNDQL
jgi:flagellar biosynthesis component FlhA